MAAYGSESSRSDDALQTAGFDPGCTLREKLLMIGAKVVRHGRYISFQLAEIAIPRALFAEILRLIDRLRPASLPP